MIIKRFRAENFRNIEKCDIEFSPGVNLLYGKNAQGKTNVVEGIYYFSRGKSFRGREDKELDFAPIRVRRVSNTLCSARSVCVRRMTIR